MSYDYDDEEYDRRQDIRDEYAAEMAEEKGRTYKYNCGGASSWSGPCGASDCGSCRNGAPPWEEDDSEENSEENSERSWLAESGYSFDDGTWSKVARVRKHTCRRDHADGTVRKGDEYTVTTARYIDDDSGESHLAHRKTVTKRFGTGTVLCGPFSSEKADSWSEAVTFPEPKVLWVTRENAETLGLEDGDAFDPAGLGAWVYDKDAPRRSRETRAPLYKIVHADRAMNLIPADSEPRNLFVAKQALVRNPAGGYPVEAHITLEYIEGWAAVTPSGYDKNRDYADPTAFSRAQGHTIRIFDLPVKA